MGDPIMASNTRDVRKFARQLRAAADKAPTLAKLIIAKTAMDTVADAKRRAPVDTGAFRDDIGFDLSNGGLTAEIGSTKTYAPYLEFGTWKMAPRPSIIPAADKHFPRAEKAMEQLLRKII